MTAMIAGLVLFLGVHIIPMMPRLRTRLVARLGENRYRGLFAAISGIGLLLIIAGYRMRPERMQLFEPWPAARAAAPLLVTVAFVLFAAANMRTHIRRSLRHPMLIGLLLWSGVHLLANGDLAGTILFGSFFAYSIVDLISVAKRGAVKSFTPAWMHDGIAIASGIALAYLTIHFHPALFGTGAVG